MYLRHFLENFLKLHDMEINHSNDWLYPPTPVKASKMEVFEKRVSGFQQLTFFSKSSLLDV